MTIDIIVKKSGTLDVESYYSSSDAEILGINNFDDNTLDYVESMTKQYTCVQFTKIESSDDILARLFDIMNKKKITSVLFNLDEHERVKNVDNITKHIINTNIKSVTIFGRTTLFNESTHLRWPNIKELILDKILLQNMDTNLIKMFPNLETLRFTGYHMSTCFMYTTGEILHMIQCSNVSELDFSAAWLVDNNSNFATQLITNTNLTKIRFDFCTIFGMSDDFLNV